MKQLFLLCILLPHSLGAMGWLTSKLERARVWYKPVQQHAPATQHNAPQPSSHTKNPRFYSFLEAAFTLDASRLQEVKQQPSLAKKKRLQGLCDDLIEIAAIAQRCGVETQAIALQTVELKLNNGCNAVQKAMIKKSRPRNALNPLVFNAYNQCNE